MAPPVTPKPDITHPGPSLAVLFWGIILMGAATLIWLLIR
jgi:hypothetical protein